jgi:hypothetical protein
LTEKAWLTRAALTDGLPGLQAVARRDPLH